MPTVAVGIDVAKDAIDICFLDENERENHQGHYPVEKYKALVKKIAKAKPKIIVLEATGGYENHLASLLFAEDLPLRILNPLRTRQFAAAIGILGKNDRIDARMLATYALRNKVEPMDSPDQATLELRALMERRRQLVEHRAAEKKRAQRVTHKLAEKSVKKVIEVLTDEVDAIDKALKTLIDNDDNFRHKEKILTSVPGVGEQTARTLLASMPELGEMTREEASSLAGVAPFPRDSGKQRGKRSIRGGRFYVRQALYMAAISASRFNPTIKMLYERLRKAGKPFKLAITACMRKMIVILNVLLKNNTTFSA